MGVQAFWSSILEISHGWHLMLKLGMPKSRSFWEDVEQDLTLRSLWAWVHLCSDCYSAVKTDCACSVDAAALLADSLQYEANMAETQAVLVEELKGEGGSWTRGRNPNQYRLHQGSNSNFLKHNKLYFNPLDPQETSLNI